MKEVTRKRILKPSDIVQDGDLVYYNMRGLETLSRKTMTVDGENYLFGWRVGRFIGSLQEYIEMDGLFSELKLIVVRTERIGRKRKAKHL